MPDKDGDRIIEENEELVDLEELHLQPRQKHYPWAAWARDIPPGKAKNVTDLVSSARAFVSNQPMARKWGLVIIRRGPKVYVGKNYEQAKPNA